MPAPRRRGLTAAGLRPRRRRPSRPRLRRPRRRWRLPARGSSDTNDRDVANLLGAGTEPEHLSDYIAPDNPLQFGGQLYLRAQTSGRQGDDAWTLTAPSLLDVYMDACPNPRVRAFILGRMSFDLDVRRPDRPPPVRSRMAATARSSARRPRGLTTFLNLRGPTTLLDQMWIRFDIMNHVFVDGGEAARSSWGTGGASGSRRTTFTPSSATRWTSSTRALARRCSSCMCLGRSAAGTSTPSPSRRIPTRRPSSSSRSRAPRAPSSSSWSPRSASTHSSSNGQKPRFGVDLSTGIWELDVYGDVGIRSGQDFCVVTHAMPGAPFNGGGVCPAPGPCAHGNVDPTTIAAHERSVHVQRGASLGREGAGRRGRELVAQVQRQRHVHAGRGVLLQPARLLGHVALPVGILFNNNSTTMLNFFYTGRQYGALFASFPAAPTRGTSRPSRSDAVEHHRPVVHLAPRLHVHPPHAHLARGLRRGSLRPHERRVPLRNRPPGVPKVDRSSSWTSASRYASSSRIPGFCAALLPEIRGVGPRFGPPSRNDGGGGCIALHPWFGGCTAGAHPVDNVLFVRRAVGANALHHLDAVAFAPAPTAAYLA